MNRGFWASLVLWCLCVSTALAVEVHDVRLWRAPDHTRVVFDLSGPADHRLLTLSNPDRIVLDVSNATLKASLSGLELANTPISLVRSGVREGRDLRVVFDVRAAVDPRSFALKANAQAGDRLVLDLYDRNPVSEKAVTAEPVKTSAATERGSRDIVIAIDAGHGGEDPGAIGPNRQREKDIVLAISRELESLLKRDEGFRPTLIRTGDYYVSLKGRRDLARQRQADLFVSIHADAFTRREANGASVYALSTRGATSTAASYLAQRENAADLIGGVRLGDKDDVLASVLTDLSMTNTLDHSLKVGAKVLSRMDTVARLHKRNVEQAGFAVLKSPDIPSILVETGFISNPGEAQKLSTRAYQQKVAQAIHAGIRDWFLAQPPPGTLIAQRKQQGDQEYTIARGDTLSGIAQRFNVPVRRLREHNGLRDSSHIMVGQTLKIPAT
ncbi:MAG: N-acetylmuramoyl-L-alanine amidase [Haliea sp.]|jgi:N-acetylmuramoyl-L-alanine amidase|uniref:N-acetylmuramoyl-L-alanine amidase n=1 Tax=Haliea sp. TaxID=1932666 RepID=UPI000C594225|nr:N-acetylmuramoyl-L-alanine amidase [Haliea sp.]MBM70958.1 N-acetylmuramoyl-L-alanine amidase [Haliea sp.]|tara:strand:- start:6678 stop:8003 length:1326 start_codon:yes stop_codon:yes gene_type:complete